MEKKRIAGTVRNKERTKQKLLDAVGELLHTKGFAGLKVNDIARTAGLDKKLIYTYFGGCDELIDEYVRTQDFWSNVTEQDAGPIPADGGKTFTKAMLSAQFDQVYQNKELQRILLWGLLEDRPSLKKLAQDREDVGAVLFKHLTDPHFGDQAERFRAVTALLISGIYYLDIYATTNDTTFCGLDLKSESGRARIKEALSFLIDKTYE